MKIDEILCTLTNKELIAKVRDWNSKLCKSNGKDWCLTIPPNPNNDPDFLLDELCMRFENCEHFYLKEKFIGTEPKE